VAVAVYVVAETTLVGIPEITPVEELMDIPAGKAGEIVKVTLLPEIVGTSGTTASFAVTVIAVSGYARPVGAATGAFTLREMVAVVDPAELLAVTV